MKTLLLSVMTLGIFVLNSCLKDSVTRKYTYTLNRPIFSTTKAVQAAVKNDAPQAIENPGKLYLLGNYIFLNDINKGIHVINNSNPSAPVNEAYIHIPGCEDLAAINNVLYADCYTDLMTLDISNPKNIVLKTVTPNLFPDRKFVNGYAMDSGKVIVDWIVKDTTVTERLTINTWLKNANGQPIVFLSNSGTKSTTGKGGSMARFTIQNNYLYTVTQSKLQALSIANNANPVWKKSIDIGWGIETIYPFQDKLFIGGNSGMYIFTTTDPANPKQAGTFTHARVCDPVIADDGFAYVTLRNGSTCAGFLNQLDVVNVSNIYSPTLVKSYQLTNPHGLSKDGQWLFICDGASGLKVFDASKADQIFPIKTIAMAETFDVICDNGIAIVSAKDGLYVYSYKNINDIQLLSKIGLK